MKSLEVSSGTSPDIDFSYTGICVDNNVSFTSENTSGDIISYTWYFDGVAGPSTADAVKNFSTTGIHTVRLEVSNGSCSNVAEKEITIYPAVTSPSFTTSGSLCTNNQISFTNTSDDTGYPVDAVSYKWYVNDVEVSTSLSPEIVFSTSGANTVKVERIISGCQAEYSEPFVIGEGPTVSFDYTGGCWETATSEAIVEFNSTVSSSDVVYNWDFGDGVNSSEANPAHQYTLAGNYDVTLEVTDNGNGCVITTLPQTVVITDQALVDFNATSGIENIPIQFTGVDLTTASDEVIGWLWDFGGEGSSADQSPAFAFSSPSTYDVALTVSTANGCGYTLHKDVEVVVSTTADVSFEIQSTICIGEGLIIDNPSLNVSTYAWDFCDSDLSVLPSASLESTISASNFLGNIEVVQSSTGAWYGFGV
ncbi:MAG: PKD domain-containing protein, partial [Owenweeksia sp.]